MRISKRVFTIAFALIVLLSGLIHAEPLGTAFTYQGRLIDANEPADGLYDLQFTLYDALTEGSVIGSAVNKPDMDVMDGYLTVELDFGSVFDGNNRWLQIGIRPGALSDPSAYTVLTGRQKITPTPYALHARTVSAPLALTAAGTPGTAILSVGSTGDGVAIGAQSSGGDIAVLGKNGTAVWGISSTGYAGYFDGKGYFSGNVGIGTTTPSDKLTVEGGTIVATNSAYSGKGVYGKATGVSGKGVYGEATGTGLASGVYGVATDTSNIENYGGYFESEGGSGMGVWGYAKRSGSYRNYGGCFWAEGATGFGVYGYARHATGVNYGVYGRTVSANGYAGYFEGGRNYFSGNVGIGTSSPGAKLEVAGVVKITGGTPGLGKVLTSDAAGLASWQNPTGSGGIDSDWTIAGNNMYSGVSGNVGIGTTTPFAKITVADGTIWAGNSALNEIAIQGVASNSGDTTNTGGYFRAYGRTGEGVNATATGLNGTGIAASANNSTGNNVNYGGYFTAAGAQGRGVYGWAANTGSYSNYGGLFRADGSGGTGVAGTAGGSVGRGVSGAATNTGEYHNYGGSFEAAGAYGKGVYGSATNTGNFANYGGYFVAEGALGAGVFARGSASGYAADFQGIVRISDRDTGDTVMLLGKGLDYAEGFHVSNKDRISPGTVLVIDRKNPGKLAVSQKAYDKTVAGIAAGAKGLGSGVRLGVEGFDCDVALAGRVYCNVDAAQSAIEPGDMLTTSDNIGYAMKADDSVRASGAILGKAMEPLEKGKQGQILVLVTLQ